jgi:hypothetical protein
MQLYEVTRYEGGDAGWRRTLSEAHSEAKESAVRLEARIRLFDFQADQQAVCGLFNGVRPDGTLKRMWRLTIRGGLQELSIETGEPLKSITDDLFVEPPTTPSATEFWANLSKPKGKE